MIRHTDCLALLPCLNEAVHLDRLLPGVRRHLPSVLVIDDGSTDATAAVAAAWGAQVLAHRSTRGKGAALRSGWQWAQDHAFSWVLTLDGDGQHAPDDIPAFLQAAATTGADLIIGNRMHQPGPMPTGRRMVNRWMSRRLSRLAGMDLPDSQCGFRLIRLDPLRHLALEADHYEIESELLLAFARNRHRIAFIPVQTLYRSEASRIRPVIDTLRWFRWWWRAQRLPQGPASPPRA